MGTNWESSTSIYTPPRVNQLAGSCCRAQGAQPVRFDDLGGWHGGRRVGRRDSERVGPQDWLGRECGEPVVCEARNRSLR